MRKIATFELIDGVIVKENIWLFDEDEDLDFFLQICGIGSHIFMFTLVLPLYIFAGNLLILIGILIFTCKSTLKQGILEGGEKEHDDKRDKSKQTMDKCNKSWR